jgi:hypothetical protein
MTMAPGKTQRQGSAAATQRSYHVAFQLLPLLCMKRTRLVADPKLHLKCEGADAMS